MDQSSGAQDYPSSCFFLTFRLVFLLNHHLPFCLLIDRVIGTTPARRLKHLCFRISVVDKISQRDLGIKQNSLRSFTLLIVLVAMSPPKRDHLTHAARCAALESDVEAILSRLVNVERWQIDKRHEIWGYARRIGGLEDHLGLAKQQGVGVILNIDEDRQPNRAGQSLTASLVEGMPRLTEADLAQLPPPAHPPTAQSPSPQRGRTPH